MSAPERGRTTHPITRLFGIVDRPGLGKWMWLIIAVLVLLLAGVDLVITREDYFSVPENVGFYAFAGFFAVAIAMLITWPLGLILKKPADYYKDRRP